MGCIKYRILKSFVAFGVLLLFVTASQGAGRFFINPKLAAGWQAESNYFKSETDEQKVHTYLIQPGFEFGYKTAKSSVGLDYTANFFVYDARDSAAPGKPSASDDDYLGHTAILNANTSLTDLLLLGLENSFWLTRNPAQTDALGNFTDRDKFWINRFTPQVYYELSRRYGAGLRYRNTKIHWLQGSNEDSDEQRGIFNLIYNFSRTAHLDLEYQYWRKYYDGDTSDYNSNQLRLFFRKQFKYISFDAGGGYQDRRFDDSDVDDISTSAYMAAINGQYPAAPDSATSNFTLMYNQNFNDQGLGNQYYVARRLTLRAGHVFLRKIVTSLDGWYQNSDYEDTFGPSSSGEIKKRDDDTYRIFGSIGYRFFDWMTFSIGGGYEERDSNIAGLSYDYKFLRALIELKRAF